MARKHKHSKSHRKSHSKKQKAHSILAGVRKETHKLAKLVKAI